MEDIGLATLVAKLEVQHQYTRDALTDIKTTMEKFIGEQEQLRQRVQTLESEVRVVRKIGATALAVITPVIGGLLLVLVRILIGI